MTRDVQEVLKEMREWGDNVPEFLVREWAERIERALAPAGEALLEYRCIRTFEEPCPDCGGAGRRWYGSTATWRGGLGGQAFTPDVCDKCWGSGIKDQPWPSHRRASPPAAPQGWNEAIEAAATLLMKMHEDQCGHNYYHFAAKQIRELATEPQRAEGAMEEVVKVMKALERGAKSYREDLPVLAVWCANLAKRLRAALESKDA